MNLSSVSLNDLSKGTDKAKAEEIARRYGNVIGHPRCRAEQLGSAWFISASGCPKIPLSAAVQDIFDLTEG